MSGDERRQDDTDTFEMTSNELGEVAHQDEKPRMSILFYRRDGGEMVSLFADRPLVVGRSSPADVVVPERSLSRSHARLWIEGDETWVEDLGSKNGTYVNGSRLAAKQRVVVGDDIRFGAVFASLHVPSAGAEAGGLESYDLFYQLLTHDLSRARAFDREVSLLMVRQERRGESPIARWYPTVRAVLRPFDRAARYGKNEILVWLPETSMQDALDVAHNIAHGAAEESTLRVGVASYPRTATSTEELIEVARTAAALATGEHPVKGGAEEETPRSATEHATAPVVRSPSMIRVYRLAQKVARAQIPVLITGETGTGKEVLANAIHQASPRSEHPFSCINCGSIPSQLIESVLFGHEKGAFTGAEARRVGVFEQSHGGTVFLDEIGELSPEAQVTLLRVLEAKKIQRVGSNQEIEVDVRIVAATHRDLEQMCGDGRFREDLLYRLNAMTLSIPPLRERKVEILPLAEEFMSRANRSNDCEVLGFSEPAKQALMRYTWPGNVRELRNAVDRAVVITDEDFILIDDLPEKVRTGTSSMYDGEVDTSAVEVDFKARVHDFERRLILDALEKSDWNQTEAAKLLKIPYRTLSDKMKAYDLKAAKPRR